MIRLKTLLGAAILSAMAFTQANACSITAWSATDSVGVVAADAGSPAAGFKRYSALCALQVTGAATAKYVQDNTPTNATTYKSRFYMFTGATLVDTGAAGFFFLARDGAGAPLIRLALTGGNITATVANGAAVTPIPVVASKYYSVELEWQQAAGTFSLKVQGAGAAAPTTQTSALTASTAVLKDVRLGLSAASTGTAFFDEYDSRRTTAPGRLLKCDANNDSLISIADRIVVNNEILGITTATGQPDANEDGVVSIADRIQVNNKILNVAGNSCN
jgi:hypothetical protein